MSLMSIEWWRLALCGCLYLLFFLVSIRKFTLQSSGFVLGLGGMTYPLYLLHNRTGKELYDFFSSTVPPLLLVFSIAAVMLLASWLIHVYLERGIADRLKFYLFRFPTGFPRCGVVSRLPLVAVGIVVGKARFTATEMISRERLKPVNA